MCGCFPCTPTTQACALTGNLTDDPLVSRPALNLLSHTSRARFNVSVQRIGKNLLSSFIYHTTLYNIVCLPPPQTNSLLYPVLFVSIGGPEVRELPLQFMDISPEVSMVPGMGWAFRKYFTIIGAYQVLHNPVLIDSLSSRSVFSISIDLFKTCCLP